MVFGVSRISALVFYSLLTTHLYRRPSGTYSQEVREEGLDLISRFGIFSARFLFVCDRL